MAVVFPDVRKTKVIFASKAEETFYTIAKGSLPDPWRIYYSVVLSTVEETQDKSGGQTNAEIDFILYHPFYLLRIKCWSQRGTSMIAALCLFRSIANRIRDFFLGAFLCNKERPTR